MPVAAAAAAPPTPIMAPMSGTNDRPPPAAPAAWTSMDAAWSVKLSSLVGATPCRRVRRRGPVTGDVSAAPPTVAAVVAAEPDARPVAARLFNARSTASAAVATRPKARSTALAAEIMPLKLGVPATAPDNDAGPPTLPRPAPAAALLLLLAACAVMIGSVSGVLPAAPLSIANAC